VRADACREMTPFAACPLGACCLFADIVKRRVVRTSARFRVGERKLAKLDRLADGQISCDTGLSSCVVCSTARLGSASPVEAVRRTRSPRRSSGRQRNAGRSSLGPQGPGTGGHR
jgi:hypothetical protein